MNTVLVADDNEDAADSLAVLLRLEGYRVRVAYDGRTALEALRVRPPDVAFLDIAMPGLNGYEVVQAIREEPPDAQMVLVAVTSCGSRADKEMARAAGFDHHFTKPVDPNELLALLRAPRGSPAG